MGDVLSLAEVSVKSRVGQNQLNERCIMSQITYNQPVLAKEPFKDEVFEVCQQDPEEFYCARACVMMAVRRLSPDKTRLADPGSFQNLTIRGQSGKEGLRSKASVQEVLDFFEGGGPKQLPCLSELKASDKNLDSGQNLTAADLKKNFGEHEEQVFLLTYRVGTEGHCVMAVRGNGSKVLICDPIIGNVYCTDDPSRYTGPAVGGKGAATLVPMGVTRVWNPERVSAANDIV